MGHIDNHWQHSMSRRKALLGLAGMIAGSPLLRAQADPHPLKDHTRILGIDEMRTAFDFEPVFRGNVLLRWVNRTAHGDASEFTLRRNRQVFEWADVIPGRPVDPKSVNPATEVLGLKLDYPILVAPTGGQGEVHPDGEVGMRIGAAEAKTPMIVANRTTVPKKAIASAASGPLWSQFYPVRNVEVSRDVLENFQALGCRAVVVTVDSQAPRYPRSIHGRNLGGVPRSPAGAGGGGQQNAAGTQRSGRFRRRRGRSNNPYRISDGRLWYTWQYLDDIRPFIRVPMLVKGIMTAEDAELCVQHGMEGIIVSNHGGRSLDYNASTLEVLPEIVAAVRGRIPVLVDGGFRRGSDVLKALALGANAVCLGRAPRWALGAFGAAGVHRVLEIIQAELVLAMAAAGRSTLASVDHTLVRTDFP